jgi:hypothetical protein
MYQGQKLEKSQFFRTLIKNNILTREGINCSIAFESRLCALCRPKSAMNIRKRVWTLSLLLRRYSSFGEFFWMNTVVPLSRTVRVPVPKSSVLKERERIQKYVFYHFLDMLRYSYTFTNIFGLELLCVPILRNGNEYCVHILENGNEFCIPAFENGEIILRVHYRGPWSNFAFSFPFLGTGTERQSDSPTAEEQEKNWFSNFGLKFCIQVGLNESNVLWKFQVLSVFLY